MIIHPILAQPPPVSQAGAAGFSFLACPAPPQSLSSAEIDEHPGNAGNPHSTCLRLSLSGWGVSSPRQEHRDGWVRSTSISIIQSFRPFLSEGFRSCCAPLLCSSHCLAPPAHCPVSTETPQLLAAQGIPVPGQGPTARDMAVEGSGGSASPRNELCPAGSSCPCRQMGQRQHS